MITALTSHTSKLSSKTTLLTGTLRWSPSNTSSMSSNSFTTCSMSWENETERVSWRRSKKISISALRKSLQNLQKVMLLRPLLQLGTSPQRILPRLWNKEWRLRRRLLWTTLEEDCNKSLINSYILHHVLGPEEDLFKLLSAEIWKVDFWRAIFEFVHNALQGMSNVLLEKPFIELVSNFKLLRPLLRRVFQ